MLDEQIQDHHATRTFGLDLAGYSTGGSALAEATIGNEDPPTVTIIDDCPFARAADGKDSLRDTVPREVECLEKLFQKGPVFVDVPIDLQNLPTPAKPHFVWELTQRPVDRAFKGLCPLADRIGAYVARMQNVWRGLRHGNRDPLEYRLFESYPAGSLRIAKQVHAGYKGEAEYKNGGWQPGPSENERQQKKNDTLAKKMLNRFGWSAENDGFILTHDEFDAALCALTGVGEQLCKQELANKMNQRLRLEGYRDDYPAPRGYVLLRTIPRNVVICRRSWEYLG